MHGMKMQLISDVLGLLEIVRKKLVEAGLADLASEAEQFSLKILGRVN